MNNASKELNNSYLLDISAINSSFNDFQARQFNSLELSRDSNTQINDSQILPTSEAQNNCTVPEINNSTVQNPAFNVQAQSEKTIPVKRKRGRPRKDPNAPPKPYKKPKAIAAPRSPLSSPTHSLTPPFEVENKYSIEDAEEILRSYFAFSSLDSEKASLVATEYYKDSGKAAELQLAQEVFHYL